MKVVYLPEALADLEGIAQYLSVDSPHASPEIAKSVLLRIKSAIDRLEVHPFLYRRGYVEGTRELVVHNLPYIVVYTVDEESNVVCVQAVFHTSTDTPRSG